MRISKKDREVLRHIQFNTEDFYMYEEEDGDGGTCWVTGNLFNIPDGVKYEYNYDDRKEEIERINKCLEDITESYLLLFGHAGTWQGNRKIVPGTVDTINAVINRMHVDDIEIKYEEGDGIVIYGKHHDGTNRYELIKPEWLSVDELKDIIPYEQEEDIRDYLKDAWECSLSAATKKALIDAIYESGIFPNYD